ncbi:MAG: zinc ribbon domain-containing protein [Bacteroidota bacterium]
MSMPVYDYRCTDCDRTYDVFHKGSEVVEDVVCPSCGSVHHKKLMSVPVVSMGSPSAGSDYSTDSSCETGGCCGGSCGLN